MITVALDLNSNKMDASICTGAAKLLQERLESLGCEGTWALKALKQTKPNKTNDVYVRTVARDDKSNRIAISCILTPNGNSSAWKYLLFPPSVYDPTEVFNKLRGDNTADEGEEEEEEPEAVQPELPASVVPGKIYEVLVEKHLGYGLGVKLTKVAGVRGMIPAAELDQVYNPDMFRYKLNQVLQAMLLEQKGDVLKFSKKAADIQLGTDGVYTGIPDRDGNLSLKGFYESFDRMHGMLGWLVEVQIDHMDGEQPLPVPKQLFVEYVTEQLKKKTGATIIQPKVVHVLIKSMATDEYGWVEVIRDEAGEEITHYMVTEFGMSEAMSYMGKPKATEPLGEVASVTEVAEVHKLDREQIIQVFDGASPETVKALVQTLEEETGRPVAMTVDLDTAESRTFGNALIKFIAGYVKPSGSQSRENEENRDILDSEAALPYLRAVQQYVLNRQSLKAKGEKMLHAVNTLTKTVAKLPSIFEEHERAKRRLLKSVEEVTALGVRFKREVDKVHNETCDVVDGMREAFPIASAYKESL